MKAAEWAGSLTEGQKKGLGTCKSLEEVVAYCKEQGIALPEELLDGVAGGTNSSMDFACNQELLSSFQSMGLTNLALNFQTSQGMNSNDAFMVR